jgi:glycosyltransferase involved in cell wall biosynthesis
VKVLMAAFACRPDQGSEPGAGWAAARAAVRAGHQVTLVTQPRHRAVIEAARSAEPALTRALHPVYVGLPPALADRWHRVGHPGLAVYHAWWQWRLRRTARRLVDGRPFDVAHQVTLSSDWTPSGLAGLNGLPLVWGPLGGGEGTPAGSARWLGAAGMIRQALHRMATAAPRAVADRQRRRPDVWAVAQNQQEATALAGAAHPVPVRPHVGLDPTDTAVPGTRTTPAAPPWRAVYAGRLVAWKGVHLALAALAEPEAAGWELHCYGDGPARRSAAATVQRLGLADRVHFHGARPRAEVWAALASAHALLHPALREAAGWVVAEAQAVGCPVVCVDWAGPATLLTRGGGVAVAPGRGAPSRLARALGTVAAGDVAVAGSRWDLGSLARDLDAWYRRAAG